MTKEVSEEIDNKNCEIPNSEIQDLSKIEPTIKSTTEVIETIEDNINSEEEIIEETERITPPPDIIDKKLQKGMGYIGRPITGYMTNSEGDRLPVLDKTKKVYLDLTKSQVIITLGKRGSGKSYTTRILLEEILKQNPYVAPVVIDKMGVYWNMKYPNPNKNEFNGFEDIKPMGFPDHIKVYIPACDTRKVKKGTYDNIISLRPNQVPFDAWCQIFDWDIMSPQARCMSKAISRIRDQYNIENYSLEDLINLITGFEDYPKNTIEAVVNKLDFAIDLGLFNENGIKLSEVIFPNIASIIDVSQSGDQVAKLITAFFAEALYETRKRIDLELKHKEMGEIDETISGSDVIPPTFLILEEFHTYMPRVKGKSISSEGLMKYMKEGRGVGLSFIGVSQEPALINTTVLRQLGVLILHNLTTDEEIKTALSIMPCPVNKKDIKKGIRTLTIGQTYYCLTGPHEPIRVKIRPAHTIHQARSENTQIFKDIANKKLMRQAFNVFKGHTNIREFKKLDKKNTSLIKKIDELNETIVNLNNQNTELKKQYTEKIEKLQEEYNETKELLSKHEELVSNYKTKISELELQIEKKSNEYTNLLAEKDGNYINDKKIQKIKKLQSTITDLQTKIKEKEKEVEEVLSDSDELSRVSKEIQEKLKKIKKESSKKYDKLLAENIKLKEEIEYYQQVTNQEDPIIQSNQSYIQESTNNIPKRLNKNYNNANNIQKTKNLDPYILDSIDKQVLDYFNRNPEKNISARMIFNTCISINSNQIKNSLKKLVELKYILRVNNSNYYKLR